MSNLGIFNNIEKARETVVTVSFAGSTYFHVKGTVKVKGVAAARRVALLDRKTLAYIKSCTSTADGSFEFRNLPQQGFHDFYVVIAFDDTRAYNAEVIDFVKQVETKGV
jgi:hypothetical protein